MGLSEICSKEEVNSMKDHWFIVERVIKETVDRGDLSELMALMELIG